MTDPALIWSYLSREPLLWLTATLFAYWLGDMFFKAMGRQSWANPVLVSVVILAAVLWTTGTSYQTYFEGAQFVHFMLGPATVAVVVEVDPALAGLATDMAALAVAGPGDEGVADPAVERDQGALVGDPDERREMAREEGQPVRGVRDHDVLDEGERRLDQHEESMDLARPEPDLERAAQQALLGQERVLAIENAVEGPVEIHTLGLAQPFGLAVPVGQVRVLEAAGVVEADPVVTHASVSSSGWG